MTEPAPTAVDRCTRILLNAILDCLDLPDILRAMRVSQLWREHAINHPTYYGKLQLTNKHPPGASEALLLRLSRSSGRSVSIFLVLDDLRPFVPHISNHLAHIRSLILRQNGELTFEPVLEALCRPADILDHLALYNFTSGQPTPVLPPDFLANRAAVLRKVETINIAFQDTIPNCFSSIRSLAVTNNPFRLGSNIAPLVLPNPFERCPLLREISINGAVTLDYAGRHARDAWERMSEVKFGVGAANKWPAFQLPISAVPKIILVFFLPETALALADTLPGPLELTFPLPERRFREEGGPILFYTAVMRSASHPGSRTRELKHNVFKRGTPSPFSLPALTDRVVRLVMPLEFWDSFVRLLRFGPFNALEELVLTLTANAKFEDEAGLPKLSCPRLKRLALRLEHGAGQRTDAIGNVAVFALECLPKTKFPLQLELEGVALTGEYEDFPEIFSSCLVRRT